MAALLDDELSPEQIDQLLDDASARLRAKGDEKPRSLFHIPKLDAGDAVKRSLKVEGKKVTIKHEDSAQDTYGIRKVEDPVAAKRLAAEKKTATAGPEWFDLPKTNLTPEVKRDIQLIKMRGVLDSKRHYKKDNGKMKAPEYSLMGTITEGAAEFFSGRVENKKRKRTIVEEVLAEEKETGRLKNKVNKLHAKYSHSIRSAKRYGASKKGAFKKRR